MQSHQSLDSQILPSVGTHHLHGAIAVLTFNVTYEIAKPLQCVCLLFDWVHPASSGEVVDNYKSVLVPSQRPDLAFHKVNVWRRWSALASVVGKVYRLPLDNSHVLHRCTGALRISGMPCATGAAVSCLQSSGDRVWSAIVSGSTRPKLWL
jgi:hypothetical protein